ncbi:MAG: DMP19 family protein [Planctomycetaceae bacterium]
MYSIIPLMNNIKHLQQESLWERRTPNYLRRIHNPDASAEKFFRSEVNSNHERVQKAAAEALEILAGIKDFWKYLSRLREKKGFENLTKPQQVYSAVLSYHAQVVNGGHSQYFVNSSGDEWKVAHAGLRAVGAPDHLTIFRKALALFGKSGPAEENDTRHQQIARFSKTQDEMLSKLDSQYYACEENMDVLLSLFAVKNKSHFIESEVDFDQ